MMQRIVCFMVFLTCLAYGDQLVLENASTKVTISCNKTLPVQGTRHNHRILEILSSGTEYDFDIEIGTPQDEDYILFPMTSTEMKKYFEEETNDKLNTLNEKKIVTLLAGFSQSVTINEKTKGKRSSEIKAAPEKGKDIGK